MPTASSPPRRAAIVAVGSELLGTVRLDTNSLKLTAVLERHGVELVRKAVIGDEVGELSGELERLVGRCDLVLVTGGLGPTADDITRPATAAALGRGMSIHQGVVDELAERFARMGLTMPEVNRKQGEVIDGADLLVNRRGTAPGMRLEAEGTTLFLFPGVPAELVAMIDAELEPWLARQSAGSARETRVLKIACVPESTLEERIAPAYDEFGREAITVLASPGDIQVRCTAAGGAEERQRRLASMVERLRELIGAAVYAEGEEATLEETVGELLRQRGLTLVTAESCTGGLIAQRITAVAGSSDYFLGAAVTYGNRLKESLLDVPARLLAEHGAVSEPVAAAMAEGARRRLAADCALAVTGIAGPGGGSDDKPVGTVHLALAGPDDGEVAHRKIYYPVERRRVRQLASQVALEILRRRLLR